MIECPPLDPKWGVIARHAGAPRTVVVSLAWALIEMSYQGQGCVAGADPEELAVALDVPPDQVADVLDAMRQINPLTGRPRFLLPDGRIETVPASSRKRKDTRLHSSRRGSSVGASGSNVGGSGNSVGTSGSGVGGSGSSAPPASPLDAPRSPSALPLTPPLSPQPPPAGGDAFDRVRVAVWEKSGLTGDQIQTKLVSMDADGLRQVRGWFGLGLSEDRILAEVRRAFADAAEPIRRPWVYLDRVMQSASERPAEAERGSPSGFVSTAVDWRKRVADFRQCRFWMDGWGSTPDQPGCEAPADVLAEFGFEG